MCMILSYDTTHYGQPKPLTAYLTVVGKGPHREIAQPSSTENPRSERSPRHSLPVRGTQQRRRRPFQLNGGRTAPPCCHGAALFPASAAASADRAIGRLSPQPATLNSPPPQRSLHSLIEDVIREILFRIPPDDPASIVRASAVCTTLFDIISDPAFLRDYRAFHGTPPMLGYLHNKSQGSHDVAQFVPTGAFCPLVCERRDWDAVDSRHGRVLVWDPITDKQRVISTGSELLKILCAGEEVTWMAAVLCAKDGCDHLGCHDGPFLVAFVGSNVVEKAMFASVYSSETADWSEMVSVENPNAVVTYPYPFGSIMHPYAIEERGHTAVVGKKVYFAVKGGYWSMRIVRYDVGEQELSLINLQDQARGVLMGEEDGALVFAAMEETKLSVWSMEAGPNGVVARGQRRVIELEKILPPPAHSWMVGKAFLDGRCTLVGFAKGAGVIFLNTEAGLFTVEVCSGRTKKINGKTFELVMPYMSFYSREHARFVMPLQSKSYK